MPTLDRPLALRLLGVACGAALGAAAVGGAVAVAVITTALSDQSDPSGWDQLGVALLALAGAVLAAVIVYPAVVVLGVRRIVAPGRRAVTVAVLLAAPVVLATTVSMAAETAAPGPAGVLAVAAAAGFVVATATGALWASGALAGGAAKRLAGGALAVAIALVGLSSVVRPAAERAALVDEYRRAGVPVALVDGVSMEAPAPGWELRSVRYVRYAGRADVSWQVGGSYVTLEIVSRPEGDGCHGAPYWDCERVGMRPDGSAIRGERRTGAGRHERLWSDVDGGRWLLSGVDHPDVGASDAVDVLARLRPVDAGRFVAATR